MTFLIFLAQSTGLTEQQKAVRDHFQKGGSPLTVLLVLAAGTLLVFLVYWLSKKQQEHKNASHSVI